MRRLGFALLLAPILAAVHCAAPAPESATDDHTEGEYIQENSVYAWAEPDYAAFEAIKEDPKRVLADDHPVTVRLQAWIDRFDGLVRAKVKAEKKRNLLAPRPHAVVYADPETVNAWVAWFPTCLGTLTPLAPSVQDAGVASTEAGAASTEAGAASTDAGSVQDAGIPEGAPLRKLLVARNEIKGFDSYPQCLSPKNWPVAAGGAAGVGDQKFANWFNRSGGKCQLKATAAGYQVGGEGCGIPSYSGLPGAGVLWSTGSGIHITTRILTELSEPAMIVVLAHELGHYYRAHGSAAYDGKYDFFYERTAHEPQRPVPAADAEALGAAVKRLGESRGTAPIDGQKLSPRTTKMLLGWSFKQTLGKLDPCKDARAMLDQGWASSLAYAEAPTSETRAAYLAFEGKLLECAARTGVDGHAEALVTAARTALGDMDEGALKLRGSLGDFLTSVDAIARARDDEETALRARLVKNRIGWYTKEQEADDLAIDLATKAGLTVPEVLDGWLEAMRAFERIYPSFGPSTDVIPVERCAALYQSGFLEKKPDGTEEEVYVPIGRFSDPHHSDCYRLFNLYREAKVHGYVSAPAPAPLKPAWAEIQAAAKAEK